MNVSDRTAAIDDDVRPWHDGVRDTTHDEHGGLIEMAAQGGAVWCADLFGSSLFISANLYG